MLDHIDNLLRQVLVDGVELLSDESQVRFQPPDEDWRTYVSTLTVGGSPASALNVYLADMRENRRLRSNERVRATAIEADGMVRESSAPRRVDCHYIISAWSPATQSPAVEPTVDEHVLLYQTIAALNAAEPLIPRAAYAPDPLPAGFPAEIADLSLPTTLLPVEGFPKLAEFWGTMGEGHRHKPAIYLIVTVPVLYAAEAMGGMVTTRIANFRAVGAAAGEDRIEVGGTVRDSAAPLPNGDAAPVAGAWVVLERAGQRVQLTRTDSLGRFQFAALPAGDYQLRASSETLAEILRDVRVPSPSGEYDLTF
jgi:hypothetical protein